MATPSRRAQPLSEQLSAADLYKAVGLLALAALLVFLLRPVVEVLLAFYAAAILAVAWNPLVERMPMRRWVSALGVGLLTLAVGVLLALLLFEPLVDQMRGLGATLPELAAYLEPRVGWLAPLVGLDFRALFPSASAGDALLFLARGAAGFGLMAFLILLASLFFIARPNEQLMLPALRLFPEAERAIVRDVLFQLARRLRRFVLALGLSIAFISCAGTLMYYALGVRFPLALGLLMGLGELVPFLGPPVALFPGLLIALLDSPTTALAVLLAWSVIQIVQSNVVWPLLVSGTVDLHPALVLFGIVLLGRLFGPLGVLLAVPVLMLLGVLIYDLWIERTVHTAKEPIRPLTRKD